jgi:ornithine cyclodeaminase/alanine dehydrogenase-like protein (mu-crystallin family)
MALYVTDEEVRQLVTIEDAITAVEQIVRDLAAGQADNRPRQRCRTRNTFLHVLCGAGERIGALGLKAYTTRRDGNRFLFLLFSDTTGECDAVIEADWLGRFRTGAATGVATRYLARPDAETLGVIGSGRHALTQILGVCAVRPIKQAYVWSPTPKHRERFASEFCRSFPTPLDVCESPREVVSRADIVCTVTKAKTPVLSGAWVKPGTHINAVGSNAASRREVGGDTIRLADVIVVDSLEQAAIECGDLLPLIEAGEVSWDDVIELADVVSSDESVRTDPSQITIFESHGLGVWDVAVGNLVLERARAAGVGTALPF